MFSNFWPVLYIAPKVGIIAEAGQRPREISLPRVQRILYSTRKSGILILLHIIPFTGMSAFRRQQGIRRQKKS